MSLASDDLSTLACLAVARYVILHSVPFRHCDNGNDVPRAHRSSLGTVVSTLSSTYLELLLLSLNTACQMGLWKSDGGICIDKIVSTVISKYHLLDIRAS